MSDMETWSHCWFPIIQFGGFKYDIETTYEQKAAAQRRQEIIVAAHGFYDTLVVLAKRHRFYQFCIEVAGNYRAEVSRTFETFTIVLVTANKALCKLLDNVEDINQYEETCAAIQTATEASYAIVKDLNTYYPGCIYEAKNIDATLTPHDRKERTKADCARIRSFNEARKSLEIATAECALAKIAQAVYLNACAETNTYFNGTADNIQAWKQSLQELDEARKTISSLKLTFDESYIHFTTVNYMFATMNIE